jgi:multidrug efflux pump subunit AcrA (membrane-fusion protein)
VLLLLVAGIAIPASFDMRAKGILTPTKKQDVHAPTPGEIHQILVDSGDMVQEGQTILVMKNPELEIKKSEIEGQLKTAQESLFTVMQQLQNPSNRLTPQDQARLEADVAKLLPQVESLKEQSQLVNERLDKLTVKSPMTGRIITWDVKRTLQNRPVETGQVLMTIAAADTDYEVELYMPERRIGHVHRWRDKIKNKDPSAELTADFISMTDPGVTHTGRVAHINPTAEPHDEQGNIVRIRVQPDETLKNARPGATVTANVHCGRAPWLWAKLHEAWEWLETSPFMF